MAKISAALKELGWKMQSMKMMKSKAPSTESDFHCLADILICEHQG
jgi:hypothetical protein